MPPRAATDEEAWEMPDYVVRSLSDALGAAEAEALRSGPRSLHEQLAYAQAVHPQAFASAAPAQGPAAAAFARDGDFDLATHFVGPDARLYQRGDGTAYGNGWRHRRALEAAMGTFTPPRSGRDIVGEFFRPAMSVPPQPNPRDRTISVAEDSGGQPLWQIEPTPWQLWLDRQQLEALADYWGWRGRALAESHLQHFLEGSGRQRVLGDADFRSRKPVVAAEARVREHFEDWLDGTLIPQTRNEEIAGSLAKLPDGASFTARSRWQSRINETTDEQEQDEDFFLAVGRSHLGGTGDFTFARQGDRILVSGDVVFDSIDPYDFEKGEQVSFVGDLPGAAWRLQEHGDAMPFEMVAKWRQKVVATLVKDGNLWRLAGPPQWMDPHPSYAGAEK
jgi:hypothetical protein